MCYLATPGEFRPALHFKDERLQHEAGGHQQDKKQMQMAALTCKTFLLYLLICTCSNSYLSE